MAVFGLGPIGDVSTRIAAPPRRGQSHRHHIVPERLRRAQTHGVHTFDLAEYGDKIVEAVREATGGRGPDSVIDEAHGASLARACSRSPPCCRTRWRRE